jgi:hypothetical protein
VRQRRRSVAALDERAEMGQPLSGEGQREVGELARGPLGTRQRSWGSSGPSWATNKTRKVT